MSISIHSFKKKTNLVERDQSSDFGIKKWGFWFREWDFDLVLVEKETRMRERIHVGEVERGRNGEGGGEGRERSCTGKENTFFRMPFLCSFSPDLHEEGDRFTMRERDSQEGRIPSLVCLWMLIQFGPLSVCL